MKERTYLAIDLKSFYASVECVDRGLDPLAVNLVVADLTRTEKTICLAVSPPLKAIGVPGRPRLFEVVQQVAVVNAQRKLAAPGRCLTGKSAFVEELKKDLCLAVDYIVAPPRMARYMEYSARIYAIYLRHVAPEDIHVYSVDEVFIDATDYIASLHCTARRFATQLILEILQETGITATAGIGSNLYLCKVAMDIVAKHIPPDSNGVRIAMLDEQSYRQQLWSYRPITDFWRVGPGYAKKLAQYGIFTMGDVARCSLGGPEKLHNEELLFRLFGVNAELLIDHAWGWEPCTIAEIKAYEPESSSMMNGQILPCGYNFDDTLMVLREMVDDSVLDLVEKHLVTDHISLHVSYGKSEGEMAEDAGGDASEGSAKAGELFDGGHGIRRVGGARPHGGGSRKIPERTNSFAKLYGYLEALFRETVDPARTMRKISIGFGNLVDADLATVDLFTDVAAADRERRRAEAVLAVKEKFGKNALIKGTSLKEHALGRERNTMVGGHHG